jgi:exodeoxyribonuclease VII large subunit
VLVRGGGSQTDFGPFDTYTLGLAVASFPIPIITGIGHERNVSIADLLSHSPVKTPTKAATFILAKNLEWEQAILEIGRTLERMASNFFEAKKQFVDNKIQNFIQNLLLLVERRNNDLKRIDQALIHLDPEQVLRRGYALVSNEDGRVSLKEGLRAGDTLKISMQDGDFRAEITALDA